MKAQNKMNTMVDLAYKQVFKIKPEITEKKKEELNAVTFQYDHGVFLSLEIHKTFRECLVDLKMHLVSAPNGSTFITSDNPVALYNQYCEGAEGYGVTGAARTGLQIFVPISPLLLLILYDGKIYQILNEHRAPNGLKLASEISRDDVDQLNLFQVIYAEENLLFNEKTPIGYVRHLVRRGDAFRRDAKTRLEEYVEEGSTDTSSSLIAIHDETPNVRLDLAFVRIRKNARERPMI